MLKYLKIDKYDMLYAFSLKLFLRVNMLYTRYIII